LSKSSPTLRHPEPLILYPPTSDFRTSDFDSDLSTKSFPTLLRSSDFRKYLGPAIHRGCNPLVEADVLSESPLLRIRTIRNKPTTSLVESMSRLGGSNATKSNSLSNPSTPGELVHKTPRARKRVLKDMRRLAKFMKNSKLTRWAPHSLIKLKKLTSKPAGCAFLESCATTTNIWLGEYRKNPQALVVDSGSDITLISQNALKSMDNPPETKTGQKVNLTQVTGTSKISGYVTVPIFFESDSGPLQLEIEAYIVKDMATPIILGNDFADQYSISLIREGPDSYLSFGNTGRKTKIEKLVGAPLMTKASHSLSIGASDKPIPEFKEPLTSKEFKPFSMMGKDTLKHRCVQKVPSISLMLQADNQVKTANRTFKPIPGSLIGTAACFYSTKSSASILIPLPISSTLFPLTSSLPSPTDPILMVRPWSPTTMTSEP
jgi:hypothetical protein